MRNIKMSATTAALLIALLISVAGCASNSTSEQNATANLQSPANQEQHSGIKPTRVLSADLSDDTNFQGTFYDFFDVSVRTHMGSPKSIPATFGRTAKVNTVRMLGGWPSGNIEADTYKWDGEKFVYDFAQAASRIDGWLSNDWAIFQIVLDNPPWAFQRGYQFVERPDGEHYLRKDAKGVYGNVLPPNDAAAWNSFIQEFIRYLVKRYGAEKVLSWRFRVGSEIDTRPQHWAATRQEFFEHYANTVDAVHSVLPEAQIGVHFREASFKSNYVDYTGNTEDSYAKTFVSWAKQNNIPYHFLAISYYPHITKPKTLNMDLVYEHDIAPIITNPDWNPDARFEIHEFKLIIEMKRAGFASVQTSHASAFFAMLAKMMLDKNIKDVYQWGTANNGNYIPEALTQLAMYPMVGNQVFANSSVMTNAGNSPGNIIDGIFTRSPDGSALDVLLFNFNKDELSYLTPEIAQISLKLNHEHGKRFKYRLGSIDKFNNRAQLFYADFPKALVPEAEGGWRKENVHETASPVSLLNAEGRHFYEENQNSYGKLNDLNWTDWQNGSVLQDKAGNAFIEVNTILPSFSVKKLEIRFD